MSEIFKAKSGRSYIKIPVTKKDGKQGVISRFIPEKMITANGVIDPSYYAELSGSNDKIIPKKDTDDIDKKLIDLINIRKKRVIGGPGTIPEFLKKKNNIDHIQEINELVEAKNFGGGAKKRE